MFGVVALTFALPAARAEAQQRCTAVPRVVQNVTAAVSGPEATLQWDASSADEAVTGYFVSLAALPDGEALTTTDVGLARTHRMLLPDGALFVRVRARNACGDGTYSAGVPVQHPQFTCSATPGRARNLRGRVESGSVIWTWEAPIGGERVESYGLEVGSWPGGADITTQTVDGFSFVTQPQPVELHARVRARNSCGVGSPSDDVIVAGLARTYERTGIDRPDDAGGFEIKIIYVVPSDGQDRQLDTDGTLVRTVAAFRKWFERQTGRMLRLDLFNGVPDIAFVRVSRGDAALASVGAFVRDELQRELMALGFNDARKVYAVYYGGTSTWACGGGAWPPTLVGSVAAMYLNGLPAGPVPCSANRFTSSIDQAGYLELAMLHEIVHTLGFVATCAPHHTRSGHSSDSPIDLMYAGDQAWRPAVLDINRDDYFAHGRNCGDLARSTFLWPSDPSASAPEGWRLTSVVSSTTKAPAHVTCRMLPEGARPH